MCLLRHDCEIRLFKPRSASIMKTLVGWLTGMPAEFSDPKFPSYSEGREVVRVTSGGLVNIQLNLLTKDMQEFGYQVVIMRLTAGFSGTLYWKPTQMAYSCGKRKPKNCAPFSLHCPKCCYLGPIRTKHVLEDMHHVPNMMHLVLCANLHVQAHLAQIQYSSPLAVVTTMS